MRCDAFALTHPGLVRHGNQDSILSLPEAGLYLVADGMGGEQAGDEASAQVERVVRELGQRLAAPGLAAPESPEVLATWLRQTLEQASREVLAIGEREPAKRGLGSTATLLALWRGRFFVAHVGDSRAYLAREGQVRQLTRDHTVVWRLYEQGLLARDQLERHPERHLLTQCIGSQRPIQVEEYQGTIRPGDHFLLCSDGLSAYVAEDRLLELLSESKAGPRELAEQFLAEALQAGGGDNISVISVRVTTLSAEDDWSRPLPDETATDEITAMQPPATTAPGPAAASRPATARPSARRRLIVGAALAVLVAALAAAIHWWPR